jgi:hypothetical protein
MKPSGEAYGRIRASAPFHRKMQAIEGGKRAAAFGFWVAAIVYCETFRTDGFISDGELARVFPCHSDEQLRALVKLLTDARLFDREENAIRVHDYLDWNRSKDEIEGGRERMADGGRKSGATRRRKSPPAHESHTSKVPSEGTFRRLPEQSREERAEEETSRVRDESSCPDCSGTGAVNGEACAWCGGSGRS